MKFKRNWLLLFFPIIVIAGCNVVETEQSPTPTIDFADITPQPVEGIIQFALEEMNGSIKLDFQTEKIYPNSNNDIVAITNRTDPSIIEITIMGIVTCQMRHTECQEIEGPAILEIELGEINGAYDLQFHYENTNQAYQFQVSPENIRLIPTNTESVLKVKFIELSRLPKDTIWFATHNGGIYDGKNWEYLEQAEYNELSKEFFREIGRKGAVEICPMEGHYSNLYFIAPWESWHENTGQFTKIDIDWGGYYELTWPEIRYYEYQGKWEKILKVVEKYKDYGLSIYGFNWYGEKVFAIKKTNGT